MKGGGESMPHHWSYLALMMENMDHDLVNVVYSLKINMLRWVFIYQASDTEYILGQNLFLFQYKLIQVYKIVSIQENRFVVTEMISVPKDRLN